MRVNLAVHKRVLRVSIRTDFLSTSSSSDHSRPRKTHPLSNPMAKRPKLTRPICLRRRSMLDKLSLEDLAPVRSCSAPGSGGAKSSESVVGGVGGGLWEALDSDTFD